MAVTSETSQVTYTANGSQTAFPVPYAFLDNSHIAVYVTIDGQRAKLTETTHYSVAGAATPAGDNGTVTFNSAPAVDTIVEIFREPPLLQPAALQTAGDFAPTTHETAFDRLTHQDQYLQAQIDSVNDAIDGLPAVTQDIDGVIGNAALKAPGTELTVSINAGIDRRIMDGALGNGKSLHVHDYGAVGDGVTDDTDAFQQCIAAAMLAGLEVEIDPLVYLIAEELDPAGPFKLNGGGPANNGSAFATLLAGTDNMRSILRVQDPNDIHNVLFDCNAKAKCGLYFTTFGSNGTYRNVWAKNALVDGVYLANNDDATHHCSEDLTLETIRAFRVSDCIPSDASRSALTGVRCNISSGSPTVNFTGTVDLTTLGLSAGAVIIIKSGTDMFVTTLSSIVTGTQLEATSNAGFTDTGCSFVIANYGQSTNKKNTFEDCYFSENGTIWVTSGIASEYSAKAGLIVDPGAVTAECSIGSAVITLTGTIDLQTLGLRPGDGFRIGTGSNTRVVSIASIDSDVQLTAATNLDVALSGVGWAACRGDGFHETPSTDNGLQSFQGAGYHRLNACAGLCFDSDDGPKVHGQEASFNGCWGVRFGGSGASPVKHPLILGTHFSQNGPNSGTYAGKPINIGNASGAYIVAPADDGGSISDNLQYGLGITTASGLYAGQSSMYAIKSSFQSLVPTEGEIPAAAIGIETGNTGAANTAAWAAFFAAITGISSYPLRGVHVVFGRGVYQWASEIPFYRCMRISGAGGWGRYGNTIFKFPAETHGLHFMGYTTSGETVDGTDGRADYSVVEDIMLESTNPKVGTYHGVLIEAPGIVLERMTITEFSGAGVRLDGSSTPTYKNANGCRFRDLWIENCGSHGMHISGQESQTCIASGCSFVSNGGWGLYDSAFLGNLHEGHHASTNTLGAYQVDGAAQLGSILLACYSESDQPASHVESPCIVIGGDHGAGFDDTSTATLLINGNQLFGQPTIRKVTDGDAAMVDLYIGTRDGSGRMLTWQSVDDTNDMGLAYAKDSDNFVNWYAINYANSGDNSILFSGDASSVTAPYPRNPGPNVFAFSKAYWLDKQQIWIATAIPDEGTWEVGSLIVKSDVAAGGTPGWRCTVAGTAGTYTEGRTATTDGTTSVVLSAASGVLMVGDVVTINSVTTRITVLSGTAMTVADAIGAGSGLAIAYSAPTWVAESPLTEGVGDSTASPGNATLHTYKGRSTIGSGNQSIVITNNLVTASSVITATVATDDATMLSVKAIPASGSFTLKGNATCTANTDIAWTVSP